MRCKIALLSMFAALTVSSLYATQKLEYEMEEEGYDFHARYKLRIPSSAKFSPKNIVINATFGPCTARNVVFATPNRPFSVKLRRELKGAKKGYGLNAGGDNGQLGITKINLKSSSPLHYAFQKLLNKIVLKYDVTTKGTPLYNNKPLSLKKAKKVRIKALPKTALLSQYYVKITSDLPTNFRYAKSAEIDAYTTSEVIKNHKVVTIKVGSFIQSSRQNCAIIKFAFKKNGLKVLSRENIDRTLPWYRIYKDAAKKSLEKYIELNAKHLEKKSKN